MSITLLEFKIGSGFFVWLRFIDLVWLKFTFETALIGIVFI